MEKERFDINTERVESSPEDSMKESKAALGAMTNYYSTDPEINQAISEYADGDGKIRDLESEYRGENIDDPLSWQTECLEAIKKERNVILSSPTGSGKTRVFLEWAKDKKERAEKEGKTHTIYITAPIKALSNQRFRELREKGLNVGLETGDIKDVPEDADYICCTQEIYTNKYLENEEATLIMDEFHYIFEDDKRARTYIDSLNKSKAKNILLASATFGNSEKFQNYVNKASGRNFTNYENKKRITSLEYMGEIDEEDIEDALVVTFAGKQCKRIASNLAWDRMNRLAWDRMNRLDDEDFQECQDTMEDIETIAEAMKIKDSSLVEICKYGVGYYFGAMLPKEKLYVEKLFEKQLIDTVVGTDALALGVNFPVQKVVFAQLAKYYDGPISKNLFEQLSGRAGRKGYFDEGEVYYCNMGAESFDYDTDSLFEQMINRPNEDASIVLTPNIKDILLGKTTIEEEVDFICRFSTTDEREERVYRDIHETVEGIMSFEASSFDYDDYDDYDEYDERDLEEYDGTTLEEKEEINKEFKENIAGAYSDEFSPRQNCRVFAAILKGYSEKEIIEKECVAFKDLLQFRKYFRQLPRKYRKNIDFYKIDELINEIDDTALRSGRVSMEQFRKSNKKNAEGESNE